MSQTKVPSQFNQVLYLIFFTSLIASLRAISSISIGLILLTGIIANRSALKSIFHSKVKNIFLAGCLLLYLLHLVSLLYTHHQQEGWSDIRIKSGLLFTPLALCCSSYIHADTRRKLFSHFCLLLAGASLYCLTVAFMHYRQTPDSSVFFYHALVSPLHQHAIYFSIFVFIALVFLFERIRKNDFIFNRAFHISLVLFFSVFLFLLSSKLVISFYLFYQLYYFIGLINKTRANRVLAICSFILFITTGCLALITRNPVSGRFYEIMNGDLGMIKRDKFGEGVYFNGLQFRILQWKFVAEILNENHRWWTGVSPGDARFFLNQKYISTKMYIGDPVLKDRGFLRYNTHNQFLETLLQTGIAGLLILLVIFVSLARMAWQKKSREGSFIIILLLVWLFSESAFETQYGLLIFTFFPLFLYPE